MGKCKRVVIKVGTNLITDEKGFLNYPQIHSLVRQIAELKQKGAEVILVSSGAVGAGRSLLELPKKLGEVTKRQVFSSIGQVKLIECYKEALNKYDFICSQILVCKQDFSDRHRYLNMKNCLESLLHCKILPVANENDTIAIEELMFTDNDELAGLIASMMNADLLMVLTNVDGLYDRHPSDPKAKIIQEVEPGNRNLGKYISDEKSLFGRGGMHTKCRVALHLASLGVQTHIANGTTDSIILRLFEKEELGTTFLPVKKLSGMKKWISTTSGQEKGAVWINLCAEKILVEGKKATSLLPVGIVKVEGEFCKDDIVKIKNEKGEDLGLGLARSSSKKVDTEKGQKGKKAFIHTDYLYLFKGGK